MTRERRRAVPVGMDTAIVWFRRDLRVHDHPALTAAHRAADRIVPLFVLDPRLLDGGRFPSRNRAWFLLECLRELRAALRDRGGELYVRSGRPEQVLPRLARETGAEAVYFASDVSPFAMARDKRVVAALGEVEARRTPGNFVADVGRPADEGRPAVRRLQPVLARLGRACRGARCTARRARCTCPRTWPRATSRAARSPRRPSRSRPARRRRASGCRAGWRTASSATPTATTGSRAAPPSSRRTCTSAASRRARWSSGRATGAARAPRRSCASSPGATSTRTSCCTTPATRAAPTRRPSTRSSGRDDDDALAAWREGRTGYPVVDAGMRQLLHQGWMHNRARLIVASFLTKDLHLDWRLGEAHFMRHLLCGDEAQNNGNWQWITSIGVDPGAVLPAALQPDGAAGAPRSGRHLRAPLVPRAARRAARQAGVPVDDGRRRAGRRRLRDRARLPGADRRPQARARTGASSATAPSPAERRRARSVPCGADGRALRPARPAARASRRCTSRASGRCRTCRRRTTGSAATSPSTSGSARRVHGRRVVDLACGEGYGSAVLARTAASVVGVDANPEAFEHARLKYTGGGVRFERDMIETWTGDVDCVVFLQTIEHVQDPGAVLDRLRELVGPGGVAYVSTPNVLTLAPAGAERSGNPWHVREYRPDEYRALCARHFGQRRPARPLPRAQAAPAPARARARGLGRGARPARDHEAVLRPLHAGHLGARLPPAPRRPAPRAGPARRAAPMSRAPRRRRARPAHAHALRRGLRHVAVRRGVAVGGDRLLLPAAARRARRRARAA